MTVLLGLQRVVVLSLEIFIFVLSCLMGGTHVSNRTVVLSSTPGDDMMYVFMSCARYAISLASIAVVEAQASVGSVFL